MAKLNKQDNITKPVEQVDKSESSPREGSVELPQSVSVRQLADVLEVNPIDVIKQLMRNGIMANINQIISYETAAGIARAFGYAAKPIRRPSPLKKAAESKKQKLKGTEASNLQPRPPVVTVMGHVDHGKTRLLDAIRQTNVMATEAGAITQHIGAYQVTVNGQKITFLDTPGHEAFTAMRAHGAQITDIIILVVAADDGVMPQTIEAINHAKAAGVPIVVAINKIDKPNANPDHVKQQLAEAGLVIEEWGGDTVCIPISAKENTGISELLENLLLVAEMEELKADPTQTAVGVVVEAELDKSRGPMATVLVQNGTLKLSDIVVVGNTSGRVRAMFNDLGKRVKKAEPATPVSILGLSTVPQVGDNLTAVSDEREAQALLEKRKTEQTSTPKVVSLTNIYDQISAGHIKELNIILKTDVQGSIEPIRSSLEKLGTEKVQIRIIHAGTGNITESDVMLAIASKGLIIGFNASVEPGTRRLATAKGIDIRNYDIIYSMIDDVEKAMKGLLEPTFIEVVEGRAEVRAVFPTGKGKKAAGVYVIEGKISRNDSVRVYHGGKKIMDGAVIASLKRFKDDVKEVASGFECGVTIKDFDDFQVGDILEFYNLTKSA